MRAWLLGAALLAAAAPARANGRFPGARQVAIAPTDPATLVLRTTFGQMLTRDGGQTFSWVCEEAIGYGGTQDPAVAITADGTLLDAAYEGTSVSHDGGCSWAFPDGLAARYSTDLTIDASSPSRALVITAAEAPGKQPAQCWQTLDDGRHWAPLAALPGAFFPQNVDIARSRPQRVYITGLQSGGSASVPTLLRSDDGGVSWQERVVPVAAGRNVYLSAVDPLDPDRLYVRVEDSSADELLVSTDGGDTYRSLHQLPGGMLGFALSPDGSRVAIGGPSGGVLVARRDEGVFTPRSATPVTCLAWGMEGLYGCGVDEIASGFALGRSTDEGATFTPLLAALGDTCGPLTTCGASSPYARLCPGRWPAIARQLRVASGPPAACGPGGGSGGQAGAGPVGSPGAGGGPAAPRADDVPDASGGCQDASPRGPGPWALPALAAALALARRGRLALARRGRRPAG